MPGATAPAYAFTAEAAQTESGSGAEFHHADGTSRTTPVTLTAAGWAPARRTRPRTTTA
ncbi:hypothetical protein [Streptomyces sp. NPDC058613]|uniref:hypothetical protein n=1 Tax=Streptomyces sp. NPDC058613 TaxID=3346556 RepID=UPI00365B9FDD